MAFHLFFYIFFMHVTPDLLPRNTKLDLVVFYQVRYHTKEMSGKKDSRKIYDIWMQELRKVCEVLNDIVLILKLH